MIINFFKKNKWLILILIIHFLFVTHLFPLSDLLNSNPLINGDYPYKYNKMLHSKELLMQGKLIGFNPYLGESPMGLLRETEKFSTILAAIFFFIPEVYIYKFWIFITFFLIPVFLYLSAKNFGLKKKELIIVAFIASIVWLLERNIYVKNYYGVFSWVFASCLCIYIISLFYKYIITKKSHLVYVSLVLSIIAFLSYPLSVFVLLIPFLFLSYHLFKKNSKLIFLFLPLLVIILFLFLSTAYYYFHYTNPSPFDQTKGLSSLYDHLRYWHIYSIILITGFIGLFYLKKNKKLFTLFLTLSIFFFLFSYFGAYNHYLSYFKPFRFMIPLSFLLIIPSAKIFSHILKTKRGKFILFILLLCFILTSSNRLTLDLNKQFSTNIPKDVNDLIFWIKNNTGNQARLILEDSGYFSGMQYGGHIPALFPDYTNRQYINYGYPYIDKKTKYSDPNFYDGILFNKPINKYSLIELDYFLNLYNIKWMVVWSDESNYALSKYPEYFKKIEQIGKFSIYLTNITPNFFIKGGGNINVDYNLITLTNLTEGDIIIKYFYRENLKTKPKVNLENYRFQHYYRGPIKIKNNAVNKIEIFE